jgi:UDP-glucose 4-epimerase
MRVLVTGGAGFIGSHVVDHLHSAGHEPLIFDRVSPAANGADPLPHVLGDVLDTMALRRAAHRCDAVIHLAAVADVTVAVSNPMDTYRTNVTGTHSMLKATAAAGVGTVIYASTVWVYGDVNGRGSVDEDSPLPPVQEIYTATKLAGEVCCFEQGGALGLAPVILRLGIPYGPRARPAGAVPRFVAAALSGQPISIAGDGFQSRPFVYVEDVASGIVAALVSDATGRAYNLCPDNVSVSIRELADVVRREVAPVPVTHVKGRPADLRGGPISAARAARELGWSATTPLSDGVRRYVRWVIETAGTPTAAHADRIGGSAANV